MHVLMVSLDDSVFRTTVAGTNTVSRLKRYLAALRQVDPESILTLLVFTRQRRQTVDLVEGLRCIPVTVPKVQFLSLAGFMTALQLRHQLPPDIITVQSPLEAGLLGWLLRLYFKVPLEVQIHFNLFSTYWLAERYYLNRIRFFIARQILRQADAIRCVSSSIAQTLISDWSIDPQCITVIPIPVFYPSLVEMSQSPLLSSLSKSPMVLFVGRLYFPKNLPALFKVIEVILRNHSDVNFVLIGDGPDHPYALAQTDRLNVAGKRVFLLGSVPYNDIPAYYQQADIMILPSRYEGFGRVLLESYLFDTPAIATKCGGPEDIIVDGETGFLTEIEAMDYFAERVLWLLQHPQEAQEMGERGRQYVEQAFNPERLIERMVNQWQVVATK